MTRLHAGGQTLPGGFVFSNRLEQTVRTLLCRQIGLRVALLSAVRVGMRVRMRMRVRVDPPRVGDDPLFLKVLTFLVKSVLEELLLESHVFTETAGAGGEIIKVLWETDPLTGGQRGHRLAIFALQ